MPYFFDSLLLKLEEGHEARKDSKAIMLIIALLMMGGTISLIITGVLILFVQGL